MPKYLSIALVVIIIVFGGWYFFYAMPAQAPTVNTGTGIKPGTGDYTYTSASGDTILVDTPQPSQTVGKTFDISGKARGPWYFEASFPVEVQDKDGKVIGQNHANANGEWMTNEFVPFTATVTLAEDYVGPATLILKKDNPSGESANDASVSFPIVIQ